MADIILIGALKKGPTITVTIFFLKSRLTSNRPTLHYKFLSGKNTKCQQQNATNALVYPPEKFCWIIGGKWRDDWTSLLLVQNRGITELFF